MKRAFKMLGVSVLSALLGALSGILVAWALYGVFPTLYRQAYNLAQEVGLGPAAGFEFVMLISGLFVVISNLTAAVTGVAIWSFLQRARSSQH